MWKDIEGYIGLYQVNENGEIKSLPKNHRYGSKVEKILKGKLDKDGYRTVSLCKNNICKSYRVHRLVASAFISNAENKPTVNHKDGNKLNNNLYNLEWATYSEQNYHLYKMKLKDLSYMPKLNAARWENINNKKYEANLSN